MHIEKQKIVRKIEEQKNKEDDEDMRKLSSRGKKGKIHSELDTIHEEKSVGAASSILANKPIVSKTLQKQHKENKKLKRYRELNYSHFLFPNQSILNILQKKNPSQLSSGLKMIRKNTMSRLLGSQEAVRLEDEDLDKEQALSESRSENSKKESKIGKLAGADRRKAFKKGGKTVSLVDIIQKDAEDPGENQ